jgi:O-antigen/teichoic acid export membrane protein
MHALEYGVWVILLQAVAYVSYLDFGLQTAVGRYVAYSTEKKDFEQRGAIFSTALLGLTISALVGFLALLLIASFISRIFPSIPHSMLAEARLALIVLAFSAAAGLPASSWAGVFVGLQRYEIPAAILGGARLCSALGVVIAVLYGGSLVTLAVVMAAINLCSYGVQYLVLRRNVPDIQYRTESVSASAAKELLGYCVGLGVMSFSMLLVTGFDLLLVGRFRFEDVIVYSIAATLVTLLSGALNAVLNVLMPHAATLHARADSKQLGSIVVFSTKLTAFLLFFTAVPLVVFTAPLIRMWIGPQFVSAGQPIFWILLSANVVRLFGAPYSVVLIATGQQRVIKISPLIEGCSNLIASIILGKELGGIGVAWGTFVGAVLGMATHIFYSMRKTRIEISFSRKEFLWTGLLLPGICSTPMLLIAVYAMHGISVPISLIVAGCTVSVVCALFVINQSRQSMRGAKAGIAG